MEIQGTRESVDMFEQWSKSQALIYNTKPKINTDKAANYKWDPYYPNCFGTFINAKFVITAATCFVDITEFEKHIKYGKFQEPEGPERETIMKKIFKRKYDLIDFTVVLVMNRQFIKVPISIFRLEKGENLR